MRPARARIDLDALRHNLELARRRAPSARTWAVVKANAYGHGLRRAARAFSTADGLALLEIDEAVRLREAGWAKPLLLIEGFFDARDLELFARHALTAVVHNDEQLSMIERTRLAAPLDVYLKINTGMNRLGFAPGHVRSAFTRLRASANVGQITLMTHFADADGPRGVGEPMALLEQVSAGINAPRSAANSAALLRFPKTHLDWVRPGIMLYGCSPFADETADAIGLKPAMTLSSEIIAVQDVAPGGRIGYAGLFEATSATRVGIVAAGYADGYPRHAPVGTPVLVGGRRSRTLGRVSMDMLFVDLAAFPGAGIGTPVTLWGEGLSADEVAMAAGTVSYELLCALSPRVPVEVTGDRDVQ